MSAVRAHKQTKDCKCRLVKLQFSNIFTTCFSCVEARCVCRQAAQLVTLPAEKAAKILPLVGLARSKQDPINCGHSPQCLYRPPPAGANMVGRFTTNPGQHADWPASVQNPSHPFYRSTYSIHESTALQAFEQFHHCFRRRPDSSRNFAQPLFTELLLRKNKDSRHSHASCPIKRKLRLIMGTLDCTANGQL